MKSDGLLFDYINIFNKKNEVNDNLIDLIDLFRDYQNLNSYTGTATLLFNYSFLINLGVMFVYFLNEGLSSFSMFAPILISLVSFLVFFQSEENKHRIFDENSIYIKSNFSQKVIFALSILVFGAISFLFPDISNPLICIFNLFISMLFILKRRSSQIALKFGKYNKMNRLEKNGTNIKKLKNEHTKLIKHVNFLAYKIIEEQETIEKVLIELKKPSFEYSNNYNAYKYISNKIKDAHKQKKINDEEYKELKKKTNNLKKNIELTNS